MAKTLKRLNLGLLEPHPYNEKIYGVDPPDDPAFLELVDSIGRFGIKTPIEAAPIKDGQRYVILSGHRRHLAAQAAGVVFADVLVEDDPGDQLDQLETLLEANRYREKASWQKVKEAKARKAIEERRAMRGEATGRVRDRVADGMGVSPRTAQNYLTIAQEQERLEQAGDAEALQQLEAQTNASVTQTVRQISRKKKRTTRKKTGKAGKEKSDVEVVATSPANGSAGSFSLSRRDALRLALEDLAKLYGKTSHRAPQEADTILWHLGELIEADDSLTASPRPKKKRADPA